MAENLHRFWVFHLATSLGWDLPRAVTNAVLVLLVGRPVLAALRRVARRAAFGAPVTFDPVVEPEVDPRPASSGALVDGEVAAVVGRDHLA